MPESSLALIILVIALALAFDFFNGFNDAANAIATVIATRALSPTAAIVMAAVLNLAGALTDTAVAKTVGRGIVDPEVITVESVGAAAAAAAVWVLAASRMGLPVSGSHSLIGGIIGAGIGVGGFDILVGSGIRKVVLGLIFSPIFGIVGGYLMMVMLLWLVRGATPRTVNGIFGRLQIVSAGSCPSATAPTTPRRHGYHHLGPLRWRTHFGIRGSSMGDIHLGAYHCSGNGGWRKKGDNHSGQ